MAAPPNPTTTYRAQNGIAETGTFDPVVVGWIVDAAKATGADPRVLLATSLQESGARRGQVGDQGTSYGPFQHHEGGALGPHDAAWANSYPAVLERAQQFKRNQVHHGFGAAAVQRPRDRQLYQRGVDDLMKRADAILASYDPSSVKVSKVAKRNKVVEPAAPDSSPELDEMPLMLEALHNIARAAKLPGSHLDLTGNPAQDALNRVADIGHFTAPTLPVTAPTLPVSMNPTAPVPVAPKAPGGGGGGANRTPVMPTTPLGKPGGGWAGTYSLATALASIGKRNGLSIASEKRARRNTTSGNMSDHFQGNKTAYAYDLSNGSKPTPQMDATAAQIAAALGVKNWKGGVLNVNKGGYRYQVLYRTNVGGNHFNHVHVGVRKL